MSFSKWKIFCRASLAFLVTSAFAYADVTDARLSKVESANQQQDEIMRKVMSRLDALEQGPGDLGGYTTYNSLTSEDEGEHGHSSRALVQSFDAFKLEFGGFITTEAFWYDADQGGDDGLSFNAARLNLILKGEVCEDVTFFTAFGLHNSGELVFSNPADPDCDSFSGTYDRLFVAWANWAYSETMQLQWGLFVTPLGIVNVEQWDPLLLDHNKPQYLRPFDGSTIFPNHLLGFNAHGRWYVGDAENMALEYNAFLGVFQEHMKAMHFGARLALVLMEQGMTIGFNYIHGTRRSSSGSVGHMTFAQSDSGPSEFDAAGLDFLWDHGSMLFKGAYFVSSECFGGIDLSSRVTWYVQPAYRVNDNWVVFYRYDYLRGGEVTSSMYRGSEHVIGVNWIPCPTIRVRLEWFFKETQHDDDDYCTNIGMLSSTVSF